MELGANLGDLDGINAPKKILKMGLGFMQIAQNEYFGGGEMMHWWGLGHEHRVKWESRI
jgi:hypothetical protein